MYVRLAFAVAAHLEPEILIIDEVLAVGDTRFQRKCLGKMQDVSNQGRTILFVSHSMAAIRNLCTDAIYLNNGKINSIGKTDEIIFDYLKLGFESASISLKDRDDRTGSGLIRFLAFDLLDYYSREPLHSVPSGGSCILNIKYETNVSHADVIEFDIAVGIDDCFGNRITHLSNTTTNQSLKIKDKKSGNIEIEISEIPLSKGRYSVTLFASIGGDVSDWIKNASFFDVEEGDFFNTGKIPPESQGVFYIKHSFSIGTSN